jgi:hypothetical protein
VELRTWIGGSYALFYLIVHHFLNARGASLISAIDAHTASRKMAAQSRALIRAHTISVGKALSTHTSLHYSKQLATIC